MRLPRPLWVVLMMIWISILLLSTIIACIILRISRILVLPRMMIVMMILLRVTLPGLLFRSALTSRRSRAAGVTRNF